MVRREPIPLLFQRRGQGWFVRDVPTSLQPRRGGRVQAGATPLYRAAQQQAPKGRQKTMVSTNRLPSSLRDYLLRLARRAAQCAAIPPLAKGGAGGDSTCADESPTNSPFARGRISYLCNAYITAKPFPSFSKGGVRGGLSEMSQPIFKGGVRGGLSEMSQPIFKGVTFRPKASDRVSDAFGLFWGCLTVGVELLNRMATLRKKAELSL